MLQRGPKCGSALTVAISIIYTYIYMNNSTQYVTNNTILK